MEVCSECSENYRCNMHAVRIVSTHQEEFLLQLTVTKERLWEQKKRRLSRFQEMRIFSVYFWIPNLIACDADTSPEDFEKSFGFGKIKCM